MIYRAFALLATAALATQSAFAATDAVPAKISDAIRATLHERVPKINVAQINRTEFAGLYEVVTDQEILYSDESGQHLMLGRIVDTQTHEDLTKARWNDLNAIDFASLPLDLAIKTVRGDGSRKIAVFSDPLCPFCQQLEHEMQGVTNVTIYTFLYPIEELHPGAGEKANHIWCAKDRSGTWSQWMVSRAEPPITSCDVKSLATVQALGEKLHIGSTPTVFLANGRRFTGAAPQDQLEKLLSSTAAPAQR